MLALSHIAGSAQKTILNEFCEKHKDKVQFSMNIPISLANFISDKDDKKAIDLLFKKATDAKLSIFQNTSNEVEKSFFKFAKTKHLISLGKVKGGKDKLTIYFK